MTVDQMPRCRTCKHMVRRDQGDFPDLMICSAGGLLAWWDNHREYEPINADVFALGGSENAYIYVSPTFGCVLHEAKQ